VYERNTKRMTEEKRERTRESEGALFRQREKGEERPKKRKRECVGLHIIIKQHKLSTPASMKICQH